MNNLINKVANYYTNKILIHGETPQGVDWNSEEGQRLRFDKLSTLFPTIIDKKITISDLGCGYGAFLDYLNSFIPGKFSYIGYDISPEMIRKAVSKFDKFYDCEFINNSSFISSSDYILASGIFNVSLDENQIEWTNYIFNTIDSMHNYSKRGFAFNCLSSYSDQDKMKSNLYYADPLKIFDYCKKKYSKNVSLLHDYDLYEFTIIVRKP
jgi:SAM-dependent methyltransferase